MEPKHPIVITNRDLKKYGIPKEHKAALEEAAVKLIQGKIKSYDQLRHFISMKTRLVIDQEFLKRTYFNS